MDKAEFKAGDLVKEVCISTGVYRILRVIKSRGEGFYNVMILKNFSKITHIPCEIPDETYLNRSEQFLAILYDKELLDDPLYKLLVD